jgi:hypothetical protein
MRNTAYAFCRADINSRCRFPSVEHGLNVAPIDENARGVCAVGQVQRHLKSATVNVSFFEIKVAMAQEV